MKRKPYILILIVLLLLLAGCSPAPAETPTTESTPPESAEAAPQQPPLSQEQAMLEGYVVMVDGDVRYNQQNFITFEDTAKQGIPVSVKLAHYNQGETGTECILYDLAFDGTNYLLTTGGETYSYSGLSNGGIYTHRDPKELCPYPEPYNSAQKYILTNENYQNGEAEPIEIYQDLIVMPDLTGITEVGLYLKEGDPPLKTYTGEEAQTVVNFFEYVTMRYLSAPPTQYLYGAKLIMVNGEGQELVFELELNEPIVRYGMQHYEYFRMFDLFDALDIPGWPDEVWAEYDIGQD